MTGRSEVDKNCILLVFSLWATAVVVGSIHVGKRAWVEADTKACDGPNPWSTATCTVTSSSMSEIVKGSFFEPKGSWYKVDIFANVEPEGGELYNAKIWKSPSYAEGWREHGGHRTDVMFESKDQAKSYRRTFNVGASVQCYINPKQSSEVSFRCRDEPMRQRYIGGVATLCVAFFPLAILLAVVGIAGILDTFSGKSNRLPSQRNSGSGL